MTKVIFKWDVRKNLNLMKDIIDKTEGEAFDVLINWFGRYNELIEVGGGDIEGANEWVKDMFKHSIKNLECLLQNIANETQGNTIVQERLKAVGFLPRTKEEPSNDEKIVVLPISSVEVE